MELSDPTTPDTSVDLNGTTDRRQSRRAKQKPVLLNKDPNIPQTSFANGKRKRADTRAEEIEEPSDLDDESSPDASSPDEEEIKDRRRKKAQTKKTSAKSAVKKVKTGPNLSANLAVRPAVNGRAKATKSARPKQSRARPLKNAANADSGLYGWSSLCSHFRSTN